MADDWPASVLIPLGELHPRHGTHDPTDGTPDRVPGSVRRTVTTDMLRPDGLGGRLDLIGRGRDLRTGLDGAAEVLAEAEMRVDVDFAGGWTVRSVRTEPNRPALNAVVGHGAGSGFRGRLTSADPNLHEASGLLHQLLDDVPVTTLVSGHAIAAGPDRPRDLPAGRPRFGRDGCAGFADGGTVMKGVDATGRAPVVTGPRAGELRTADPWAWHELPPLPRHAMRRARRTDVVRDAGLVRVDVLYRDSHVRPDGLEIVIHEYVVSLTCADNVVRTIEAVPRALPWVECPAAAASAQRLVGVPLSGLRAHVRQTFGGISTCSHLNDTLRSLEDVPELVEHLSTP